MSLFRAPHIKLVPILISYTLLSYFQVGAAEIIEMRIVDEPTVYSWQQNNDQQQRTLKMKIEPSPFSGPDHLKRLLGKCFKKTFDKYEYEFCPFSNITQKDVGISWNAYQGILGVWQEWHIEDNHFISMMMNEGDNCGAKARKTEVKLVCAKQNEIDSVTEPHHCEYSVIFLTPLVCHNHSMLVYPTLSTQLQTKWNLLLSELKAEEITEKGYRKSLNKIYQMAGLKLSKSSDSVSKEAKETDDKEGQSNTTTFNESPFNDLHSCNNEYESLKKQLDELKDRLDNLENTL